MLVELGGGPEACPGGEEAASFTNTVPGAGGWTWPVLLLPQPHVPAAFQSLVLHPSANPVNN